MKAARSSPGSRVAPPARADQEASEKVTAARRNAQSAESGPAMATWKGLDGRGVETSPGDCPDATSSCRRAIAARLAIPASLSTSSFRATFEWLLTFAQVRV